MYEEGLRALAKKDFGLASSYFFGVTVDAQNFDRGGGLFVQREDGYWIYRQDEISELYALAAYRRARIMLETEPGDVSDPASQRDVEDGALKSFCTAIEARPDVIRAQTRRDQPLARVTQRVLQRAQRRCRSKEGWRSETTDRPDLGSWNDPLN